MPKNSENTLSQKFFTITLLRAKVLIFTIYLPGQ